VEAQVLRGNASAGLKDLDAGIEEIQEAINLDPDHAHAHFSLDTIERAASRTSEAQDAFMNAIEADPASVTAHLALANFYWALRMTPESAQTLRQVYTFAPDHPLVNRMVALFKIATGKSAEAEPYLKKLAAISNSTDPELALADYYFGMGRSTEALYLLHELAVQKSVGSAVELRLAAHDVRLGRHREAHRRLDELLVQEPDNAYGLILKARLYSAEAKVDEAINVLRAAAAASPRSAEPQFALGRAYLARREPVQAIKAFNEVLRLNPRAVAAQVELSQLELTTERPEGAIHSAKHAGGTARPSPDVQLARVRDLAKRDLRKAQQEVQVLLTQYPDNLSVLTQAGLITGQKGDRERATRLFSNALGLHDGNLETFTALVSLDLAYKDPATAIARVEPRLKRMPNSTGTLLLAARVYEAAGKLKESEQALRRTIEVDASNLQAYDMLSRQYISQKRLDEALNELKELSPRSVQAHTLAGILLEAKSRAPEARKHYELALTIDPTAAVAAHRLAWMYAETGGTLDIALQHARTAMRSLPDSAPIRDTLGWIYYRKGLAALAIPVFQKSVDQDPTNPTYSFHFGLAHAKAGDSVQARQALQQALALDRNFKGADQAKQLLNSLER
jgi:tetratricopeptide (TPR) repeat protein